MPLSLFHLHGDLKDLRFPRLLAALREDRFTGVFQATTTAATGAGASSGGSDPAAGDVAEVTREVHFLEGRIAWAISTEKEESLRAYMVRNGALTASQWAEAEQQARDQTVRDALVSLGMVSARELTQIEKGRAEEILLVLFSAREGEYRVRERQLSPGTPDLKIDPRPLILKGVLEQADQGLVLEEIGSLDAVYAARKSAPEDDGHSLPGEFQSVLRHIDGKRSIAQICALTSLPDNFVCSVVAALSMTGAVKRHQDKPPAKGRTGIVQGAEVAPSVEGRPDAPAALTVPACPAEPPRLDFEDLEDLDDAPAARESLEAVAQIEEPFARGEQLEAIEEEEVETAEDEEIEAVEDEEIEGPEEVEEIFAGETPAGRGSVYADPLPRDTSRPWFVLGGGAAVGLAAIFFLLMGQNPGDAGEVIRPVTEAAPTEAPAAPEAAAPARIAPTPDEPEYAAGPEYRSAPAAGAPVAPPSPAPILTQKAGPERNAHASLEAGDYAAAARQFGREVSRSADDYTIQLLTACQDNTVGKAVQSAGGSDRLFILSASLDGRNCYRVYWGRYPSPARAREALRREVPEFFLRDRSQPRVTRLGGV